MKRIAPIVLALVMLLSSCSSGEVVPQQGMGNGTPTTLEPAQTPTPPASLSDDSQPPPTAGETPPTSAPPEPDMRPENIWYHYSLLDPEQKAAYLELYESLWAYINDDGAMGLFSFTLVNPAPTIDGRLIFMSMAWDNPVIAQYFGSIIDVTVDGGNMIFHDISDPDQRVFGDITDIRRQIREIEAAADVFLRDIDPYLDDYGKYLAIAEKVSQHIVYNYSSGSSGQSTLEWLLDQSVYGGLVNRLGVCEGFANTFQYLCQRAGLFCMTVYGGTYAGDHAWNIIRLDDGYYHVDTTWMQTYGRRYFCLTDAQIAVERTIISQYHPECSGIRFAYDDG
jgi:hypothetical protein